MIPNESKMAMYAKRLSKQLSPQIGTVVKPDGATSLIEKETHDIIINTHFPNYTPQKQTAYNLGKKIDP